MNIRRLLLAALLPMALLPAQAVRLPKDDLAPGLFSASIPAALRDAGLVLPGDADAEARFNLGRRLFFDPVLSRDRTVACASCHDPRHGFSVPEKLPPGIGGRTAKRNAPTLFNRALGRRHSWDGRAATLQEQMLLPIPNEDEMGLPLDEALERLGADAGYGPGFRTVFGRPPTRDDLAEALAAFVGRLVIADSPVETFRTGRQGALTPEARGGLWIFESKGHCWRCHSGPNWSDEDFHNTGVGVVDGVPEAGREAITGDPSDQGRFKTPTLRALALTPPYMHDGSLASLADVVAFYRRGGGKNSRLDQRIEPLDLTDEDARHLVAFLEALSR